MEFEHWSYTVPLRLRSLLKRSHVERELDEELEYHIELQTAEFIGRGLDPTEARHAAIRAMNGLAQRKEECRDARRVNLVDNAIKDVRYGLRMLAKAPAFTVVAILTLAIGIGANTAIFSIIDAVLLKPLQYPDPDRIVQLMLFSPAWAQGKTANTASVPEFNTFREQQSVFQQISAYEPVKGINLVGVETPEQLRAIRVSAAYFSLFGVPVAAGRTFSAEEDRPGGPPVCVITQGLRERRFAGVDPVGKVLALGRDHHTIIGVLDGAFVAEGFPDVFLPLRADPASTNAAHGLRVAARLKPGVTLAQARAQLKLAHEEFLRKFPSSHSGRSEGFTAEPLWETTVGDTRRPLLLLAGAVGLVLLIACANVANLLMARATVRAREIAVRAALGASRRRIASQLLIESLLLALAGGACGVLVAQAGVKALMAIRPNAIPRLDTAVELNTSALLFTLFLSIASGLFFGIIPALTNSTRVGRGADLIGWGMRSATSAGQKNARSILVVAEVALALVLLMGAGLLVRSFWALRTVDPGFDARNVLTMEMSLAGTEFQSPAALARLIRDAERRIEAIPGVVAAAATLSLPLESQLGAPLAIEGHPDDRYGSNHAIVSAHYFDVFRIPVREGRAFGEADDEHASPVAVVNEAMAQGRNGGMRWSTTSPWRTGSPLSERVTMAKGLGALQDHTREIVGVVGEVRDAGLNRNPIPMLYTPLAQITGQFSRFALRGLPLRWVVRTSAEPHAFGATIERELRVVSGGLPVAHVRSMEQVVSESTARERFHMTLLCVFAGAALLLGAVGVYGLMAYTVQHRTQEIGVRVALGARPRDVRAMVVLEGMRLVLMGIGVGVAVALLVTPLMRSLLFGVEAHDPLVLGCTVLVLGTAALASTYVPAYRATRVDPVTALRWE